MTVPSSTKNTMKSASLFDKVSWRKYFRGVSHQNKQGFWQTAMTTVGIAVGAHLLVQSLWIAWHLWNANVKRTLSTTQNKAFGGGITFAQRVEHPLYTRIHRIEDGIEWISYYPKTRRHETPILMQHGMWHGAWCWQHWQELFAEWGWESHAISLPGHGQSPEQRPIAACTLDYYLCFLRDAIQQLPRKPILMGHSMGGALTQYYLKYVADNLPAAVLVAPWALYKGFFASSLAFAKLDPLGGIFSSLWWRSAYARSPQIAAAALISKGALYTPEELYDRLGDESALVTLQHFWWKMPPPLKTPLLWLSGELDAVVPEVAECRSANAYHADYKMIPQSAHNLMMEHSYKTTAHLIDEWLADKAMV